MRCVVGCVVVAVLALAVGPSSAAQPQRFQPSTQAHLMSLSKEELVSLILGDNTTTTTTTTQVPLVGWPPIWPHPHTHTSGQGRVGVDPGLRLQQATAASSVEAAFERFVARTFGRTVVGSVPAGSVAVVVVNCDDPSAELQLGVAENYELTISESGETTITAPTQFGVYHALETLSQLVVFDVDTRQYWISQVPWDITDTPRFAHRELLVDSARHFLPLPTLKRVIDSMTFAKLNTLHWHLTDYNSFPLIPTTFPSLGMQGSYSSRERYSMADVAHVVQYATQRGVRVIPEIDSPGHANTFCRVFSDMCPGCSILNPASNTTFDVLEAVWKDLTGGEPGGGVFTDPAVHIGADEVSKHYDCWNSSTEVLDWMAAHNFTLDDAYGYFVGRVQQIVAGMGREAICWEDAWLAFGSTLNRSVIVQHWLHDDSVVAKCTAMGFRMIYSAENVAYLDKLDVTWQTMYLLEPCASITDEVCAAQVLGGSGSMWGETVDTSDVMQTVWPRAAALAERMWSPRSVTDLDSATPRLQSFRCLLNQRGIAAAPVNNPVARSAPVRPGSCYGQ